MTGMLRERQGKAYDPKIVDVVIGLAQLDREAEWSDVLAAEPEPIAYVDDIDQALSAVADYVDIKSAWTRGHSRRVADLAENAGRALGMSDERCRDLRRAALVHDLGRVGVENGIWDKPAQLATWQWEKVRLHPYLTERILSRCPALAVWEMSPRAITSGSTAPAITARRPGSRPPRTRSSWLRRMSWQLSPQIGRTGRNSTSRRQSG